MSEQQTLSALKVSPRGLPMLLVEDDELVAAALTLALSEHGFSVIRCGDSQVALERLRNGLVPSLIVLDLWTPHMDGWQFRMEQRRDPRWSEIPVIAMSADRSAQATAIDAAAFVAKPIDEAVLLETITQVLIRAEHDQRAREHRHEVDLRNTLYLSRGALGEMRTHVSALESALTGRARSDARALSVLLTRAERLGALTENVVDARKPNVVSGAFARGDCVNGAVDVAAVLRHSVLRAALELPPRTLVYGDFAADTTALADARKLDHVFINLLRNAAQAMTNEVQQELFLSAWHDGKEQLHVSISDTGCGYPLDTHEHIFDVFPSGGVEPDTRGLGLAVARGMVEEMGGTLDFTSFPGIGSTFRLNLRRPRNSSAQVAEAAQRLGVHVLLVDNDAEALERRRKALAPRFRVSAMSMWHALQELFAGASYDMVLCDATQNHLPALSFYATLVLRCPEQGARLVLLRAAARTAAAERLRRNAFDAAAIWHVPDAPASELAETLRRMIALWDSIGLRRPAPSCTP